MTDVARSDIPSVPPEADQFILTPRGPFDLTRSIQFLEEWPAASVEPGRTSLRFAYCTEQSWQPIGVGIASADDDLLVTTTAAVETATQRHIARILSVDVDATGLDTLGHRDAVVARLLAAAPGLRPVCFWSPWEAACWAVLSQRTSMRTASALKRRIAEKFGTTVTVDGQEHVAFPAPHVLLSAPDLPGVNPAKLERIRSLATSALRGDLTAERLRAQDPAQALTTLRELPGIGPFSAALILIRGAGAPNVFTMNEPRLLSVMREVYQLSEDADDECYATIAEAWSPFRSWIAFLLRSASGDTIREIMHRNI